MILLAIMAVGCGNERRQMAATDTLAKQGEVKNLVNYWDDFDFNDTLKVKNADVGEQKLVNFIARFSQVRKEEAEAAINNMLGKAEVNKASLIYFAEQYNKYLYDPNSPMHNDVYYEMVLKKLAVSRVLDRNEKIRWQLLLATVKQNQPGTKAENFSYVMADGQRRELKDVVAPYTVLFFYEPGCHSCETAIKEYSANAALGQLIRDGKVKVLAVYTDGDMKIWREYMQAIPGAWLNVADDKKQIINNQLYDLKAWPTVYLLDGAKQVMLKDCGLQEILAVVNKAG